MNNLTKLIEREENGSLEIARHVYDIVRTGGLVLAPDGIGYGLIGHSDDSIRRIYDLKRRKLSKPCTHYMGLDYLSKVSDISERDRDLIADIAKRLPACFVVPIKEADYFAGLGEFAFGQSTKDGTVALFFEQEDSLVREMLKLSLKDNFALIVSSANSSGLGNAYRFDDIPQSIIDRVDLAIKDPRICKYFNFAHLNGKSVGSTIIKLPEREILRRGVLHKEIERVLGV